LWIRGSLQANTHQTHVDMLLEQPMPREFAVPDAYIPTILVLFLAGSGITWILDRVIAFTGLYRVVWHPSLFRVSLLICVCSLLGLTVYR
jgi:protein AaeX